MIIVYEWGVLWFLLSESCWSIFHTTLFFFLCSLKMFCWMWMCRSFSLLYDFYFPNIWCKITITWLVCSYIPLLVGRDIKPCIDLFISKLTGEKLSCQSSVSCFGIYSCEDHTCPTTYMLMKHLMSPYSGRKCVQFHMNCLSFVYTKIY